MQRLFIIATFYLQHNFSGVSSPSLNLQSLDKKECGKSFHRQIDCYTVFNPIFNEQGEANRRKQTVKFASETQERVEYTFYYIYWITFRDGNEDKWYFVFIVGKDYIRTLWGELLRWLYEDSIFSVMKGMKYLGCKLIKTFTRISV